METMITPPSIREKLVSVFETYTEIAVVYLFGSQATGAATPRSDFDIAVYFREPDVVKRHDALFALSGAISRVLNSDRIDIHSINDIQSPLLKYRIVREGIVLFEREPYRVIIEPRILNEHTDFLYLLKKYHLTAV